MSSPKLINQSKETSSQLILKGIMANNHQNLGDLEESQSDIILEVSQLQKSKKK